MKEQSYLEDISETAKHFFWADHGWVAGVFLQDFMERSV